MHECNILFIIWTRSYENVSYAYANNTGADQLAYWRSLINTFVFRCFDSMICILAISKVSRSYLASEAEQSGLNVTWSKIAEDTFSRNVAHMIL